MAFESFGEDVGVPLPELKSESRVTMTRAVGGALVGGAVGWVVVFVTHASIWLLPFELIFLFT